MTGRLGKTIVLGAMAVLAGCAALVGIEDTTDVAQQVPGSEGGPEAGVGDDAAGDAGDPTDEDAGPPTLPFDSGFDDGGDPPPPPDAGLCDPVSAFLPVTGAAGTVCNAANVLAANAGAAGLDYTYLAAVGHIDGKSVTSCVGAEFTKELVQIVVRASQVGKACDSACGNGYCGDPQTAYVFAGSSNIFKYVGSLALRSSYADFQLAPPGGLAPHEVVVCRPGNGAFRDDVNVYAIFGTCLP